MAITYFKRYRMEYDLKRELFAQPPLPLGYWLFEWQPELLEAHSSTKYESFRYELDVNIFPCLGDSEGCYRLMQEISGRTNFVRQATWLIGCQVPSEKRFEYCATIQGLRDTRGHGSIQNVGVRPQHRNKGLGKALLFHALNGFQMIGMERAALEVTAQNTGAIRLYESLGFVRTKTVYKAVDLDCVY